MHHQMTTGRAMLAAALSGLTVFVALLLTAAPIGVTWDEPIYCEAAERAVGWLGLIARGEVAQAFDPYTFGISWGLVNEHPPLMRVLNGLGWAATRGLLPLPTAHRVGAMLLASVALGVLVGVTGQKRGIWPALFAGAAVLTMPRLFLHAHLAALDFPHAATWILATLAFYAAFQKPRPWSPLLVGVGLGLALLTKINAVLLVPCWGLWLLLYHRSWRHLAAFVLTLPVGLSVLIAGWPWVWQDPVGRLINWARFFQVHFEIRQWFAGHLYVQTPWYLPPAMIGITTPVILLALATLGIFAAGKRQSGLSDWTGLHLLGLLVVPGYYMLPLTSIHDQERLLLPAFVHLAVLAADGFAAICSPLSGTHGRPLRVPSRAPTPGRVPSFALRHALCLVLAVLLLLPGFLGILRLHPFELSYYNELVGGLPGAQRLGLETTYFASTYGYFLPWLNRLPAGSRLWVMPNSWDVIYYYQRHGLLQDDLVLLRPPGWGSFYDDAGVLSAEGWLEAADYALIDRRQTTFNAVIPEYAVQLEWAASKPELARLERDGVLLAALYGR